jgi:hypothetical protein
VVAVSLKKKDMFSFGDMICFQSGFQQIRSLTVLIVASALTLLLSPVFNPPEFLIMFNCQIDEHL